MYIVPVLKNTHIQISIYNKWIILNVINLQKTIAMNCKQCTGVYLKCYDVDKQQPPDTIWEKFVT